MYKIEILNFINLILFTISLGVFLNIIVYIRKLKKCGGLYLNFKLCDLNILKLNLKTNKSNKKYS